MSEKKKCGCLFCNSKCPECGSTDIQVKCAIEFTFTNDTEDRITIGQEWGNLEINCEACGAWIDSDHPKYRELEARGGLQSAIMRTLNIPDLISIEHKDGGKIKVEPFFIESVELKGGG